MKEQVSFRKVAPLYRPLLTCCCAALFAHVVEAQEVPDRLPPTVEPGRQVQQPKPLEPVPEGAAIAVPEAPATTPPPGADRVSFNLTKVSVAGATLLSEEEIQQYYTEKIGQAVTVADMFAVAAAIENEYRNRGYVTSRALVPEQQIEGGAVRILVIEGFISEIAITQDIGPARAQVEALLAPLRGVKPINIEAIERRLLLANDLNGVAVRGTLQPATEERGASKLVITTERRPFDMSLAVDNRNSPYTGEHEAILRGAWNSFTGNAGTLTLQAKSAFPYRREHLAQVGYEQSIGADGMTANLTALGSRSNPGRNLIPLQVESQVLFAAATVAYPLIRSRLLNLQVDGTFDYSDLDTDVLGRPYTRDRLRVLRLGLTYDRTDTWRGVNAGRIAVSQGLDIFNASPPSSELLSRFEGRSDFTKIGLQFVRLQTLSEDFSLLASLSGQITWDSLLASEQLGLGGPEFGRAYDTSEVSGDKGVAGVLELRYRPAFASVVWNAAQFFVFYDVGKVWNVNFEVPQEESLASAGAGVRLDLPGKFFAAIEIAAPLTHAVASEGNKPTRVFFSIATHL